MDSEPYLALKTAMMPRDTNKYGTIFGGVLLSYIDLAAGIGAHHFVRSKGWPEHALVTVAMDRIEFKQAVFVGDTVSFWTNVERIGNTSITLLVSVETERNLETIQVTQASATFVAISESGAHRSAVPLRGSASEDMGG
ncbi:MAG: hotdog domain-containing protein [Planctomycetaceae bacterium]